MAVGHNAHGKRDYLQLDQHCHRQQVHVLRHGKSFDDQRLGSETERRSRVKTLEILRVSGVERRQSHILFERTRSETVICVNTNRLVATTICFV